MRACKDMNVELENPSQHQAVENAEGETTLAQPRSFGSISTTPGTPYPLGASLSGNGVNFALRTPNAQAVTLWLYFGEGSSAESAQVELTADQNKTEDVWHVCCLDIPMSGVRYAYSCAGPTNWRDGHR